MYGFGELDALVPACAATIHKAPGSEYPAVVIPVTTQHYPMLQRNLLAHRDHAGEAASRDRRAEARDRDRGERHKWAQAMVAAEGGVG